MEDNFLSVEEAAERLKVTVPTLRRWLRDGILHGEKFGRLWRIRESELIGKKEKPE